MQAVSATPWLYLGERHARTTAATAPGWRRGCCSATGCATPSVFVAPAELPGHQLPAGQRPVYAAYSSPAASTFQYQINDLLAVYAIGNAQRYQTRANDVAELHSMGHRGWPGLPHADPVFRSQMAWGINLSVNQQWWTYDAADPIIDPARSALQSDTIINLVLTVPFDERTTFSVSAGRFNRASSLPNYAFTDNSVLFGVSWRF